ncbi:hypothetical protein WOLCODRAFT_139640 [Wolfiporia cocos MD-104 SS10]|uniref:Rhodopsin domain-containing protein n=1 Tax=Wolfiporia cocos (strain MD-104) TaxID=742152 RepID=A0A2H3J843_WOLCO|nr:hypothetical protein WOLCODRAFT_139640 [Wolfiporia cocos MD-104 SS10]
MSDSSDTTGLTLAVRVVNFVLPSIAILVTIFRLYDRASNHRLWWDDAFAALSMLFAIVFMAAIEMHAEPPTRFPRHVEVSIYYMAAQFFYLQAWAAKLSILFTVIRLSVWNSWRRLLYMVAVSFAVAWAILFAQVWWICESEPGWKYAALVQCDLGRNTAIAQVITDVISDAILIIAPVRMVWGVRLSRAQKIRLIAIFSTTMITTAVGLDHAYWILKNGGLVEVLAAVIETSISLIVANLSVIVALLFRISADGSEFDSEAAGTSDVITFGHSNAGRSRRRPINILTTTFIMSDNDGPDAVTTIKLDSLGPESNGQSNKSPGHLDNASGDLEEGSSDWKVAEERVNF